MKSLLRAIKRRLGPRSPLRLLWHHGKALLAALRFGFPAKNLTVIGITGTDGKTTTVAMVAHILAHAGKKVGAVSTTFLRINEQIEWNATHKTSLPPLALQRFLRRCARAGCAFAVVEASSHGLVQGRLNFLRPAVAAVTNTSLEHLDYHGTMEQYRKDKGILFRMLRGRGVKVLSRDDDTYAQYLKIPSQKTIVTRARTQDPALDPSLDELKASLLALSDIEVTAGGSRAVLHEHPYKLPATSHPLSLAIPGAFNLENALCAIGCAAAAGVSVEESVAALGSFRGVPGRLESIDEGQPFAVFVDFTVTPLAYEKTLESVRRMIGSGGRLLVLASSCGDRMREKRAMIGKVVSERADVVAITEDETLTEDPLRTIEDVWAGIDHSKTQAHKIPDRRSAIQFLLEQARPGDAVVLCGMGACTTMQTREGLRPWDERAVARELLRTLTRGA